MQLMILWMGAAEGTFKFDLELKKWSSIALILDKNSYTLNWIPNLIHDIFVCFRFVFEVRLFVLKTLKFGFDFEYILSTNKWVTKDSVIHSYWTANTSK